MKPKQFGVLVFVTYGAMAVVYGCHRTDTTGPVATVSVTTLAAAPPVAPPAPSTRPPAPTSTNAPETAHDALQADLAAFDAIAAINPETPCQEWLPLAIDAGWPTDPKTLETLGRVIWRETRCRNISPLATNVDDADHFNGHDHGLTQINQIHAEWVETIFGMPLDVAMSDPWRNLHFAFRLWESRLEAGKCPWQPWSIPCD